MEKQHPQVTILPRQTRALMAIQAAYPVAVGMRQVGSVIHADAGERKFIINPNGRYKEERELAQEAD